MDDRIEKINTGDGSFIKYRILRRGPRRRVLVLIHGLASNMTRWSEFTEFTELKDKWDIILVDLRGHGGSQFRKKITMERWCSDIAAILKMEGYDGGVIGGHCLGANIAINFSLLFPEMTEGLVLLEPLFTQSFTGALVWVRGHRGVLKFAIILAKVVNTAGIYRREIPPLDLRELDREARILIEEAGTPEILTKRYASPVKDMKYISVSAYMQSVRELLRPLPPLDEVKVPKLFIFSSGRLFKESEDIEKICGSLENCELVKIDSYHWLATEKPVELREAIERWCMEKFR